MCVIAVLNRMTLFILAGIFWKGVEILDKIIETFQNKTETATKLRLLPLLTDALTRSESKIDYFLRMIEEITFGIAIKLSEPFLERLIKYTVRIIIADKSVVIFAIAGIAHETLVLIIWFWFCLVFLLAWLESSYSRLIRSHQSLLQ